MSWKHSETYKMMCEQLIPCPSMQSGLGLHSGIVCVNFKDFEQTVKMHSIALD